jgi:hypothetical protein
MDWARVLAYATGTVDQELLARNEYLAAENRILKAQLKGRLKLLDAERAKLGEIGHRLGRKALAEVSRQWRGRILSWPGTESLSPASSMARKPVAAQADLCGALGPLGEGGVLVQGDPLGRVLAAAGAERIRRALSCRAQSPGQG